MVSPSEAALTHQGRVIRRSETATQVAVRLWSSMDITDLDGSWDVVGPEVSGVAVAAQVANASDSNRFVNSIARGYGDGGRTDTVVAEAFAGVDGSGRDLDGLLRGSVVTTKQAIGAGMGGYEALLSGASYLAAMMKTALADIGRSSDLVGASAKQYTRYVRVVNPGACSRCAILAGKSDYSVAFKRHPACRCTSAPVKDDQVISRLPSSPEEYFESLSEGEQNRVFTRAGAEAIRLGSNPISVVSARRGATGISTSKAITAAELKRSGRRLERSVIGTRADGRPILGFVTTEGATVRGSYGRVQTRIGVGSRKVGTRYSAVDRARLMPETIIGLTPDPELRRVLLRDAGYLDPPINDYRSNAWIAEHARIRAEDRVIADQFYRSAGVAL
jgi:hypothetical protein